MRSDCREIRGSLGAYALRQLPDGERATVEGHLAGCPECGAELESLAAVTKLLPLADPTRIGTPPPRPPSQLGERIAATIGAGIAEREERQAARSRRRLGFACGGLAAAAAAAVLAIIAFTGDGSQASPEQHIDFTEVPQGVAIDATLQPHAFGTEISMYVTGVRPGTLCRVFLVGEDGQGYAAGSFRYRWRDEAHATLSSALDLSRTKAIEVRAGDRTFKAPVDRGDTTASVQQPKEEEAT